MRTPIAILSAAGLVLALAACGTPGGDATASACAAAPSGAASNAVKVTGDFGTAPTVTFDGALSADATQRSVVITGDQAGEQAVTGTTANIQYTVVNGTTGETIDQSDYTGTPSPFPIDEATFITGVVQTLECSYAGDRVVGVIPPLEAFGETGSQALGIAADDSIVFIADIISVDPAPEPLVPEAWTENVPKVDLSGEIPVVTIPDAAAPTGLVLSVLEEGDGEVVEAGSTVELDYQGTSWDTGEVFDQSYGTGSTASFPTSAVIEGFAAALVGQKVGTTLIVSVPPEYAYGTDPAAHALGGQTLVFLIHIIGTSAAN